MENNTARFTDAEFAENLKTDIDFLKTQLEMTKPLVELLEKDLKYKVYCLDTLTFRELTKEEVALLASNENEVAAFLSSNLRRAHGQE